MHEPASGHRPGPFPVVHILGSLRTGGAEMALVNYLKAADRENFTHSVICLTTAGPLARQVEELGVPVMTYPVRLRNLPQAVWGLAGQLKARNATVVHTHMFTAAFWGRLAGLVAGVPVLVTTEHGKEPWKKGWQILIDRMLGARTYRQIAVSEDVRNIRIARDSAPPERIVLIPNSVPVPEQPRDPERRAAVREHLGLAPDQPVLGTVGRVVDAKAYPVLVEAMTDLTARIPGLKWLQVGDGPDLPALQDAIAARGLKDVVLCLGRRDDVGDLLQAMDVWVMSSRREGLPVALLEAMASRLPIVATDVGGIPDAVENERSALLVPAEDPAALAAAIARVFADPSLADRLAAQARQDVVARYGNTSIAHRIEEIYRAGLRAKGYV